MPKVRREFLDQDYLKTLNDKELAWLSKFMGEYYGANLDFKNLRKNIHRTKKLKKECTDRNNRQNNDLFGVANVTGLMNPISAYSEQEYDGNPDLMENVLIEKIDRQRLK